MIRYERHASGDLTAVCEVAVGVERRTFRVPLGTWPDEEPPAGGLREAPVVVLPDHDRLTVVRLAVNRAGGVEPPLVPPDGGALLRGAQQGAEVMIVTSGGGRTMNAVAALGGRPIPALTWSSPAAIIELLEGCLVDVDVAVPRLAGRERATLRATVAALHLDALHHVVEVDPRPGSTSMPNGGPDLDVLGAAAAGVLAVGSRRWRAR
ncbi:MAG TPA: hypothetical protein VF907_04555 [Actinomycetota bacterium]